MMPPLPALLAALNERFNDPKTRLAVTSAVVAFATVYLGGSLREGHGYHARRFSPRPPESRGHTDRYQDERRRRYSM